MWDGRETFPTAPTRSKAAGRRLFRRHPLRSRRPVERRDHGARAGDCRSRRPSSEAIVEFETALATAQVLDQTARSLSAAGAEAARSRLRPDGLLSASTKPRATTAPAAVHPMVFDLYDAWSGREPAARPRGASRRACRGQVLFNSQDLHHHRRRRPERQPLNPRCPAPSRGRARPATTRRTSGNHSIAAAARHRPDGRVAAHARHAAVHAPRIPPPATIAPTPIRGARWSPGSGRTSAGSRDRSCASSPPRAAVLPQRLGADLGAVVDFYNERFNAGIVGRDRDDLIAFLRAL